MSSLDRKMHRNAERARTDEERVPDVVAMCARLVAKAMNALEKILDDPKATAATLLRAANSVLDRVYGKPSLNHNHVTFRTAGGLHPAGLDTLLASQAAGTRAPGGGGPLPGLGG